jgi:hypothetical protein
VSRQQLIIEFGPGRRPLDWQSLLWLLPALALLAGGLWQVGQTLQARADERQAADARVAATKSAAARQAAAVDPQAEARNAAADRLASRLNRPWSGLLEVFESADTQKVAVLAVQPNLQTGMVQVVIEAASLDEMVNYFQTLQGDERLTAVSLVSHERQDKTPGSPVRAQLTAHWSAK